MVASGSFGEAGEADLRPVPGRLSRGFERLLEPKNLAIATVLGAVLSLGIAVRLHYATFLDPFEDGFQNWWISANLVATGEYWDRHSMMTQGNWLPLYHFFAAGALGVTGLRNIEAMKLANIALSSSTALLIFLILRKGGPVVALAGFAFFVFNFIDIIVGGWSTAESLLTFLVVLAYAFLFHLRLQRSWHLVIAAAALTLAVSTRYEAWAVVLLLAAFVFVRFKGEPSRRTVLYVLVPPVLFMGGYFLYALQWGFLPAIVVQQTSTDLRFQASIGTFASPIDILGSWWAGYFGFFPVVLVVGGTYLALKFRSEFGAWVVFGLWGLVVAYVFLRFGNPSYRYVMLTVPFLSIAAAIGLKRGIAYVAARRPSSAMARPIVPVAVVIVALLLMVPPIATYWSPGFQARTYMEPMERAGRYVASLPIPDGKILVSESPIAAYFSGLAPDRMLGSRWLPDDRAAALDFLKRDVAYVVYVGVPYYKLRVLFPELEMAATNLDFELVYDAGGRAAGTHSVLVYRVLP